MSDNESSPSRIPTLAKKLTGKDNYRKWRFEAEVALKYYRTIDLVKGIAKEPVDPGERDSTSEITTAEHLASQKAYKKAHRKWEDKTNWAVSFILNNIDEEVKDVIPQDGNPAVLWKALEEQFDLQTVTTLFMTFANLTSLQYSPENSLKDHLTTFANIWRTVVQQCAGAQKEDPDDFAWHLKNMTKSNMSKKNFLLQTLRHESLANVVENVLSKESITFAEIHDKLMAIAQNREISGPDAGSFNVKNGQKPVGGKPPTRDPTKECSFCKKNGDYYKSHTAKECNKKRKAKKEAKQNSANVSEITVACWVTTIHYSSFIDQCFVDTEYPEFSPKVSAPEYADEWTDMNWERPADPLMVTSQNHCLTTTAGRKDQWIFDTGATDHMSGRTFGPVTTQKGMVNAAGHNIEISGNSTAHIKGSLMPITLTKVLHVPKLGDTNLISWRRLAEKGFTMEGKGKEIRILKDGVTQGKITLNEQSRLYTLDQANEITATALTISKPSLWHQRLGHLPSDGLRKIKKMVQDPQLLPDKFEGCTACQLGKATKLPRTPSMSRTTRILELIHSDLSGKQSTQAPGGYHYFMSLIDDFSRFTVIVLLKNKSDAPEAIKRYISAVETQTGLTVQRFRTDNGGEYVNTTLKEIFSQKGIKHETIVPYSHESNGVAERFNRTIQDLVRTAGISSGLPPSLWGEAVSMLAHVKNRLPHASLEKQTPFEAYFKRKPTIGHLRYFGEVAYVFCPPEARKPGTKLSPRAEEGKICGFGESQQEYRVYLPSRKQIVRSRDVRFERPEARSKETTGSFFPSQSFSSTDSSSSLSSSSSSSESSSDSEEEKEKTPEMSEEKESTTPPLSPSQEVPPPLPVEVPSSPWDLREEQEDSDKTSESEKEEEGEITMTFEDEDMEDVGLGPSTPPQWPLGLEPPSAPSHPNEWAKPKDADIPLVRRKGQREVKKPARLLEELLTITSCPTTFKEATNGKDKKKWEEAMKEEYDALILNEVWEVVPRPSHPKKVVKSRWVYTQKLGPNGEVTRHKARFVAKGFSQIYGVDYEETFSPVFRYESLRMLFAITASHPAEWDTRQSDVKNAFLNGKIKEEVYVEQPLGYEVRGEQVLKLKKTLYGLKQSPREWHAVLFKELEILGLRRSSFDPSVFINKNNTLIIAAFVDDLGIFFCDATEDKRIASHLAKIFRMTDGGKISWIVGIKVVVSEQQISLSQSAYIQQILERFDMVECRTVTTPFENHGLVAAEPGTATSSEIAHYQAVVGSLMYAALGTRPDITFAVTFLSQFSSNPGPEHTTALQRVLRYLRGTIHQALVYPRKSSQDMLLKGFADASHASDMDSRKSFSGNCFLLNNCLVTWKTEKQKSVAISSTEAEYMALSEASRQMVWLKRGLDELALWTEQKRTYKLFGDNTGSLALTRNPVFHRRSKHIETHFHYIRERYLAGDFVLSYVPTADNAADLFTKGLGRLKHVTFLKQLNCLEQGRVLE